MHDTTKRTALIALLLCGACGETEPPRTRVQFSVDAAGSQGPTPASDFGWKIGLTEAKLHLRAITFFEGHPLFASTSPRPQGAIARATQALLAAVTIPTAEAHPGHYVPGESLGDLLDPATIDLLAAAPKSLGEGGGVSGEYNSVEVLLSGTPDLSGHTAVISGEAEKDGRKIRFHADVDLDAPVSGIAFGAPVTATGDRFLLTIDLPRWTERIDFSALPTGTSTITFPPGSQGHNAILRGVINTAAFVFTRR